MKLLQMVALVCLVSASPVRAQVVEPKEIKNQNALKAGEGVLRLSMRSQRQFIETAYLYFVRLNPDGSDGTRILRFERGAGVPVMGSNMIDVKARYYGIPEGSYRLLAYTVACSAVPAPGSTCFFGGHPLPTEAYVTGSPTFEVAQGAITDGGDFVIEYTRDVDLDHADLFDDRYSDEAYGVRWRPIGDIIRPEFAALRTGPKLMVPARFKSRIECEKRPRDKKVQFPFRCPAAGAR